MIFSKTLPLFKRELPENARFRNQFRPLRAQNTKKNTKKISKNLNDLKFIFLELFHQVFVLAKFGEIGFFFFLYFMTLVGAYSKLDITNIGTFL